MARKQRKPPSARKSGFEDKIAALLKKLRIFFEYEPDKFKYTVPAKVRTYTPDFKLADNFYIETKGYLDYDDQQKMILFKQQHPDIRVVLLFQKPYQRLPRRKITHAAWAIKHGYEWTDEKGLEVFMHGQ